MIFRIVAVLTLLPAALLAQGITVSSKTTVFGKTTMFGSPPSPPSNPPAYVGGNTNQGSAVTSLTVTYTPTSFATGEWLIIGIGCSAAMTVTSVKDQSGTYTFPLRYTGSQTNSGSGSPVVSQIYADTLAGKSAITSIVITLSSNTCRAMVEEYSGVGNVGQIGSAGNAGSVTSASLTMTTQASNNILTGIFSTNGGSSICSSGTTGTCRHFGGNSGAQVAFADNTVSSPGSVSVGVTWTTSAAFGVAGLELSSDSLNSGQDAFTSCGTASSCTATFIGTPIVGDAIVAAVDLVNTQSISSVTHGTDTGVLCGVVTNDSSNSAKSAIYVFTNIQTTGATVVLNLSASGTFSDIHVQEVNGANTSNACDATGTSGNTEGGVNSTSLTPGASTATNAKTLAVDYCSTSGSAGPWTFTSGWFVLNNTGGELVQDKHFSSVQSNLNPLITATTASAWQCQLASIH